MERTTVQHSEGKQSHSKALLGLLAACASIALQTMHATKYTRTHTLNLLPSLYPEDSA